jgi:hypothetical protein
MRIWGKGALHKQAPWWNALPGTTEVNIPGRAGVYLKDFRFLAVSVGYGLVYLHLLKGLFPDFCS